jgi:2,3-bisphosphoglycerate-independent phosphoglycerate mutase
VVVRPTASTASRESAGAGSLELLIILDGATDFEPSSLELAHTPALDRLAREGSQTWLDLLTPGVPVGSETAIAALLGWAPDGPVDRARVEAAARGIAVGAGERVWRVDLSGAHKLLVFGEGSSPGIEADVPIKVWPDGAVPPRILDSSTVVIGALGAATGLGALMGARVVVPPGATGCPDSDLAAKRRAALDAVSAGAARVVVHVGGADEASHRRDRALKIAVIERADEELIGPLAEAVAFVGGELSVCTDHGTDPVTGEHIAGPVPWVRQKFQVNACKFQVDEVGRPGAERAGAVGRVGAVEAAGAVERAGVV